MTGTVRYRKPDALARLGGDRHALIEASAGTGKTYTIEHLVVDLLLTREVSIRDVLVITFAERAAAELKSRIRGMLVGLLLRTKDHGGPSGDHWTIGEQTRKRIETALCELDLAAIHTIHAFYLSVLRRHTFHGELPFAVTQDDKDRLFRRAFREALRGPIAADPEAMAVLNAKLASSRTPDPFADLAESLGRCHQARGVLHPPVRLAELAALLDRDDVRRAFSAAALEIARSDMKAMKVPGGTITAVVKRLATIGAVLERPPHGGAPLAFALEHGDELGDCLNGILASAGAKVDHPAVRLALQLRGMLPTLNCLVASTLLPHVREALARMKSRESLIDFDDMIDHVDRALAGDQGSELASDLRRRYRFALVDEFQDTDAVQWRILKRVFLESGTQAPCPSTLFLVGDPKQAIYAFRGADVQAYVDARESVAPGPDDRVHLVENHRSTEEMIQVLNVLFGQAPVPFFTHESIGYDAPVTCGKPELSFTDPDRAGGHALQVMRVELDGKTGIDLVREMLGRFIAEEVARLIDSAAPARFGSGGRVVPVQARDIFVLTSSNKEGDLVASFLGARGIKFAFYKKDGLFETREAEDVLALLEAVADPGDRSRRTKAWLTPFFAVPLDHVAEAADLPETDRHLSLLVRWKGQADDRAFDRLFSSVLNDSGVVRRDLFCDASERRVTNYLHIFEILAEQAYNRGCDIDELVRTVRACMSGFEGVPGESGNVQRLETEKSAVQIMTMHRSKGLEAPVVFLFGGFALGPDSDKLARFRIDGERRVLVGTDCDAPPLVERERREESQRLLYVAATRAKGRLYLPLVVPPTGAKSKVNGVYAPMNERLLALRDTGSLRRDDRELRKASGPVRAAPAPLAPAEAPSPWAPDSTELFADDAPRHIRLRLAHRDWIVTSYTSLQRHVHGQEVPEEPGDEEHTEREAQLHLAEDDLPGGVDTGVFLHALLEELDFGLFAKLTSFGAWCKGGGPPADLAFQMTRYGLPMTHLDRIQRMLHAAWTVPIPLPGQDKIEGLHTCHPLRREVEFLYPYPEASHPPLFGVPPAKLVIERGFVKGFIDLLFTHRGRVYFADWKSNVLPGYAPAALAGHVTHKYALQARLYTIAVTKILGVASAADHDARFGGLLYVFLRGLDPGAPGTGIHFERPSFDQVREWNTELRVQAAPQDRPPPVRGRAR